MPATAPALLQALATAIATVVHASPAVQGWAGRTTDLIRTAGEMAEWSDPILVYVLTVQPGLQRADATVFAYATDSGNVSGQTKANEGLALVQAALTAPALYAAGVDAVPYEFTAGEEPDPETAGAPSGAEAQMSVTFLLFG